MSLGEKLREYVRENRTGMVQDLLFAAIWVGVVSLLFEVVFPDAPTWAFYLCLLAGIPAYFGFFISLDLATASQKQRDG